MAVKPVCSRCSKPHWRFVSCDKADEANQADAELDAAREAKKVIPIYRSYLEREPKDQLTTLVQQAPGVFVKKRPA